MQARRGSAATLLIGVAIALAACNPAAPTATPALPSAATTAAPATAGPSAVISAAPSIAAPTPTPVTGLSPCNPADLAAQVIGWDAGAGHRNATVKLTNNGAADCTIRSLATPQLVDGSGTILINGTPPASSSELTLGHLDVVNTMVSVANYCGTSAPRAPVTVAFVFPGGEGRVVAAPVSPTDLDGVPPCDGPGPGSIDMHPFAP